MSSQLASWKLLESSNDNLLLRASFAQIRVKSSFTGVKLYSAMFKIFTNVGNVTLHIGAPDI